MAMGAIAIGIGEIQERRNKKKLQKELANAPKYQITEEAKQNQAIAKASAFGRDRSIQQAQEDITQGTNNAVTQAKDVTNSTSSLLATISQLNQNKNQQMRTLAQDDQAMRFQKQLNLQDANNAMIDEKDKAWNYNQNMPFQMRVAMYRDKIKSAQEQKLAGLSYEAQTVSSFAEMMGGMMGACDEKLKEGIVPSEAGIEEVINLNPVKFTYVDGRYADHRVHIGFIAQEVEKVVPEVVRVIDTGTDQHLIVDFKELVPVLVKAIQQQQGQIQALKEQVSFLVQKTSNMVAKVVTGE